MNLLTKTTPWMIASLLVAATAFGDNDSSMQSQAISKAAQPQNNCCKPPTPCCKPPPPPPCKPPPQTCNPNPCCKPKCCEPEKPPICLIPAYNAPARIDVRCSWDVYASASFIYWQMSQDNMEYAFVDELSNASFLAGTAVKGNYEKMDFDYHPGFKVGLGVNFEKDDWDSYAEYTRLHGTNSTSVSAAHVAGAVAGAVAPVLPSWGHSFIMDPLNAYNTAHAKWRTNLDIGDLDLGRVYYVGKCLTFRTAIGLRGAWILQNLHARYVNTTFVTPVLQVPGVVNVYARTHSWAVGPRAALNTNWMIGCGTRLYGNASGDILYTRYRVQSKTAFQPAAGVREYFIGRERVSAPRAHLDLELGLGWGSYFDNQNWHVDLSASYGFQVFFNQNMFPRALQAFAPGTELLATGNLYAQGLTATVRIDF